MSALKKGLNASLTGTVHGSFLIKKKKSSPCGPYFSGTFHSMDAVRKYTLSIGSKWSQTPSQIGFSHKLWRKPTPAITRHPSTKLSGRELPIRILHTLQSFYPVPQSDLLKCSFPKVLILSCFSPGCSLHAWDRSFLLLHPWLPSVSRGLLLSGPPTPTALLISL